MIVAKKLPTVGTEGGGTVDAAKGQPREAALGLRLILAGENGPAEYVVVLWIQVEVL